MPECGPPFSDDCVRAVFDHITDPVRSRLLSLRQRVFEVAERTPEVGVLTETLKWGQPAYLTNETKSGTPVRLGPTKDGGYALFVHCQTSIIREAREIFRDHLHFEGNRAVRFSADEHGSAAVEQIIHRALTYKLR